MILFVLLYCLIIMMGLLVRVPRKWYWLICTVVLCFLVNTSETYSDLPSYTNIFNSIGKAGLSYSNESVPIGWIYLCLILYNLGFSYRGMIIIVIFISMYLIHYSLKEYSISEGRFWALFLVFPALLQCVQVRFFLATSIVFYSVQFLFKKGKNGLPQYIVGIAIASSIHVSCLIFFAFAIITFIEKINFQKVMSISLILSAAVAIFKDQLLSFIIFLDVVPESKLSRYFYGNTKTSTVTWIIIIVGLYFGSLILMWFFENQTQRPILLDNSIFISGDVYVKNRMMSFACLLTFTLPLLLFDSSMYRFIEVGLYVIFCFAAWYWKNSLKPIVQKLGVSIIFCLPLYYVLRRLASVSAVLGPFFSFQGFHSLLR